VRAISSLKSDSLVYFTSLRGSLVYPPLETTLLGPPSPAVEEPDVKGPDEPIQLFQIATPAIMPTTTAAATSPPIKAGEMDASGSGSESAFLASSFVSLVSQVAPVQPFSHTQAPTPFSILHNPWLLQSELAAHPVD